VQSRILVLTVLCVLAVGCDDGKNALQTAPAGAPAMPAQLPKVDLCGSERDTTAYLRRLQKKGGAPTVVAELSKVMSAPVELTICAGGAAPPQQLRSNYVYLQLLGQGKPKTIKEWGDASQNTGTRSWSVRAFVGHTPNGVLMGANYVP
jgi:hypothetical protein